MELSDILVADRVREIVWQIVLAGVKWINSVESEQPENTEELLASLYPRLDGILKLFFRTRGFSSDAVQDLTQETLARVIREVRQGDTIEDIVGFAIQTARFVRWEGGRELEKRKGEIPIEEIDCPDSQPDPEHALLQEERLEICRKALKTLSDKEQEIVRRVIELGESREEVGHRLGMTANAVRIALHRAVKKIEKAVRRECGTSAAMGSEPVSGKVFQ